MSDVGI